MTQARVAAGADINEGNLSYILSGRHSPTLETINAILAYCRQIDPSITYDFLIRGEAA